jgi:hypothetical protein
MTRSTTMTIRVPEWIVRRIDAEVHRRRMNDANSRAVSRTAVVVDAVAAALGAKPPSKPGEQL